MITYEKAVEEHDRVIGFVGMNDKGQLLARTPNHGWELIEGVTSLTPKIADALRFAISATYYSEASYA